MLPDGPTKLPDAQPVRPICWKCGYDLSGLLISGSCPECGTPVWSTPTGVPGAQIQADALVWGIVSLILCTVVIGPPGGFVAIPAIIKGRRAMAEVRSGRTPRQLATSARTGLILGWIAVGVSVFEFVVFAGALLIWLMRR